MHTFDIIDIALNNSYNTILLSNQERMYCRLILMIVHNDSPNLTIDLLFLKIRSGMHNPSKVILTSYMIIYKADSIHTDIGKLLSIAISSFNICRLIINYKMLLRSKVFRLFIIIRLTIDTSFLLCSKLFIGQRRSNIFALLFSIHKLFILFLSNSMDSLGDTFHLLIDCFLKVGHIFCFCISHLLLLLRKTLRIKRSHISSITALIKFRLKVIYYSDRSRIRNFSRIFLYRMCYRCSSILRITRLNRSSAFSIRYYCRTVIQRLNILIFYSIQLKRRRSIKDRIYFSLSTYISMSRLCRDIISSTLDFTRSSINYIFSDILPGINAIPGGSIQLTKIKICHGLTS